MLPCEACGAPRVESSACSYCRTLYAKPEPEVPPVQGKKLRKASHGSFGALTDVRLVGNHNVVKQAIRCEVVGNHNRIKHAADCHVLGNHNIVKSAGPNTEVTGNHSRVRSYRSA